jgi:hypothetical protein
MRSVSLVLVLIGIVFGALWLVSIGRALVGGTVPEGVAEIGLPVNPIHVLDLALVLPLAIVTARAHWKRQPFGLLFATPLLVFFRNHGLRDHLYDVLHASAWGIGIARRRAGDGRRASDQCHPERLDVARRSSSKCEGCLKSSIPCVAVRLCSFTPLVPVS